MRVQVYWLWCSGSSGQATKNAWRVSQENIARVRVTTHADDPNVGRDARRLFPALRLRNIKYTHTHTAHTHKATTRIIHNSMNWKLNMQIAIVFTDAGTLLRVYDERCVFMYASAVWPYISNMAWVARASCWSSIFTLAHAFTTTRDLHHV